jgi:hypothetical protein
MSGTPNPASLSGKIAPTMASGVPVRILTSLSRHKPFSFAPRPIEFLKCNLQVTVYMGEVTSNCSFSSVMSPDLDPLVHRRTLRGEDMDQVLFFDK